MSNKLVEVEIKRLLKANKAFVAYICPSSDLLRIVISNNIVYLNQKVDFVDLTGFVFHPFALEDKDAVLFPVDEKKDYYISNNNNNSHKKLEIEETCEIERNNYLKICGDVIECLNETNCDKIVLTRCIIRTNNNIDISKSFNELLLSYTNTFRYLLNVPEQGIWMGASPEKLICKTSNIVNIDAIAGTRRIEDIWDEKNKKEHTYTERYIENILKQKNLSYSKESHKMQMGGLSHLYSSFFVEKLKINEFSNLVYKLHPTPSVCGLPKALAKKCIFELEKHDREFYCGFLGPCNIDSSDIQFFVNIRCMKISFDNLFFFVGGGIIKESTANTEFVETELKLLLLKDKLVCQ